MNGDGRPPASGMRRLKPRYLVDPRLEVKQVGRKLVNWNLAKSRRRDSRSLAGVLDKLVRTDRVALVGGQGAVADSNTAHRRRTQLFYGDARIGHDERVARAAPGGPADWTLIIDDSDEEVASCHSASPSSF